MGGQTCMGRVHRSFVLQGPDWDNTVSLFPEAAHLPKFSAWSTILIENNIHFQFPEVFFPKKSIIFSHDWLLCRGTLRFHTGSVSPLPYYPHFLSIQLQRPIYPSTLLAQTKKIINNYFCN